MNTAKSWCEQDDHAHFHLFSDFNDWLDSSDIGAKALKEEKGLNFLSRPSKALFAGDREAYDQAFREYRIQQRHESLSADFISETLNSPHWFERNERRIDQLVEQLIDGEVVPFIGAGLSCAGGFPTWANHLRAQGVTAGIEPEVIENHLANGEFEDVIETIEAARGTDVFTQEIRDTFSATGRLESGTLLISELFNDTLITTNYDRLLEQSFDTGPSNEVQIITGINAMEKPASDKVTLVKIHGDVKTPRRCILSKQQYAEAYGENDLDLSRPIPRLLRYFYLNSSLLFIGCSLNNDRTIQVFEAVKQAEESKGDIDIPQHFSIEQASDDIDELTARNAELLKFGVTPIWYPKGDHDKVEAILRHAKNELNFLRAQRGD